MPLKSISVVHGKLIAHKINYATFKRNSFGLFFLIVIFFYTHIKKISVLKDFYNKVANTPHLYGFTAREWRGFTESPIIVLLFQDPDNVLIALNTPSAYNIIGKSAL